MSAPNPDKPYAAFLSSCCGTCGKVDVVRCDTVAEIPTMAAEKEARGWVYNNRGCFCSERCAAALPAASPAPSHRPPRPRARQRDLFNGG